MNELKQNAPLQLMQFITAKWISTPIYVVTKLNVPHMLTDGPKPISEIAKRCSAHEPHLYRVMRALASVGIFSEMENKTFELTPMAELLTNSKMKSMALFFLSDWHNKAWANLLRSVQTGETAFEEAFGMPAFEWLEQNKESAESYYEANNIKATQTHSAVIDVYDFSKFKTVADIGGGYGGLLFKILEKHKHLKGILADRTNVIENVNKNIKKLNLENRCKAASCDFFKEIPMGYDAYILSNILHDWDEKQCHIILKNCFKTMDKNSKLLIIETIIPEGNEFSIAKLLDLEVLVMGGGKERTEKEYRALLKNAGFILENILDTKEHISILECAKSID